MNDDEKDAYARKVFAAELAIGCVVCQAEPDQWCDDIRSFIHTQREIDATVLDATQARSRPSPDPNTDPLDVDWGSEGDEGDPEDYDLLHGEWMELVDHWTARGASASAIWAFMASVLLSVARENDCTWEDVRVTLETSWQRGEELEAAGAEADETPEEETS